MVMHIMNGTKNRAKPSFLNDEGFSLLGALIGMAIFVIGILAVFALQTTALTSTGKSAVRSQGITWLHDTVERLYAMPYDDPNLGPANDPLEPGKLHEETQGPYTIRWAIFTSTHNGQSLNSVLSATEVGKSIFNGVKKTQPFRDIPDNVKLIVVHVDHPREQAQRFVFAKADI
jgi:Tfp pilus assembly protein PilV